MYHRKLYIIEAGVFIVWFLFCVLLSSPLNANKKCDNTVYDLLRKGRYLSEKEVIQLEQKLLKNPNDLSQRIKLLGYYELRSFESEKDRKSRHTHILWIIENNPDDQIAGLPPCHLDPFIDGKVYDKARELWHKQTEIYKTNSSVLGNAANFSVLYDKDFAETLFKKVKNLEPTNPEWPRRLGHLYALGINSKDEKLRREASLKALNQFEFAYKLTVKDTARFYLLSELAEQSFEAGDMKKAEKYAAELLIKAAQYQDDWNYGNAIHIGNIILGRCALKSGQLEKAGEYLILSGKTPGSPQLNSFGPNMMLAHELLQEGEREVVIKYFQLCEIFWKGGTSILKSWTSTVKNGGIPDFNAKFSH